MLIRSEKEEDISSVYSLNKSAFESDAEAKLVNVLRSSLDDVISLVALDEDTVVGHIMFSPVAIVDCTEVKLYGLAPMAVNKKQQQKGIGTLLVEAGLKECKAQGISAVFVLGHPNYYPRFGFTPANKFGIQSEYDVPQNVFMAIELVAGSLNEIKGVVKYDSAFSSV